MTVAKLSHATIVFPRSHLSSVAKQLSEFDWFHYIKPEVRDLDPVVNEIRNQAFKLYVDLKEIIESLAIPIEPGIMDMLFHGYDIKTEEYTVNDWKHFIDKLETDSSSLVVNLRELLDKKNTITKQLADTITLESTHRLISNLSINLENIEKFKRIFAVFAVVLNKDLPELTNSLSNDLLVSSPINNSQSAVLIASTKLDADRIDKVLRSFEIKSFTIPAEYPANPKEAYSLIQNKISELEKIQHDLQDQINDIITNSKHQLLALHEASLTAYQILDKLSRVGQFKRFAIVKGYIVSDFLTQFKDKFGNYIVLIDPANHHKHDNIPTLLKNKGISKAFNNITLNQGPPKYGEVDPTPITSFIFPIFFGIMFADLGHGLVLFGFSAFLYKRGNDSLKQWATIFMLTGISASIAGIMIGEVFGFSTKALLPFLGQFEFLHVVNHTTHQLNLDAIMTLLKISWLIGIFHIGIGLFLGVLNGIKENEFVEVIVEKIPTFLLYFFGVIFGLAFIGAGLNFGNMLTDTQPLPLLPFINNTQATLLSLSIILPVLFILMFGKSVAIKMGKVPGEDFGESLMVNPIETLFEKLPGFLSNTISYGRLGVLLVVHAALMIATNAALNLGVAGLVLAIICNILIILMEGLIVYIQTIRLHLYEWFTKFYDGSGTLFRKINPETKRIKINWK